MNKVFRFLWVWTLFWSAIVLAFDVMLVRAVVGQLHSLRFRETAGTILSSEVTSHSDSEGTSHRASVVYEYSVAGAVHRSDRVRFGQMGDSNPGWARRTVAENPAGAQRPVYYDPADPSESVLQTGISGQDLFLALFLTPFNAVMVTMWVVLARNHLRPPLAGGARIRVESDAIQVWYASMSPAFGAVIGLGGTAFVSIFALGFTFGGSPPLAVALWVWALMGAAGGAGYFWRRRQLAAARPDLTIDAGKATITLQASAGAPVIIPLEQVRGVEVKERVTPSGEGESRTLVPVLLVRNGPGHDLGSWFIPRRAEAFAAWLRETLALPPAA